MIVLSLLLVFLLPAPCGFFRGCLLSSCLRRYSPRWRWLVLSGLLLSDPCLRGLFLGAPRLSGPLFGSFVARSLFLGGPVLGAPVFNRFLLRGPFLGGFPRRCVLGCLGALDFRLAIGRQGLSGIGSELHGWAGPCRNDTGARKFARLRGRRDRRMSRVSTREKLGICRRLLDMVALQRRRRHVRRAPPGPPL